MPRIQISGYITDIFPSEIFGNFEKRMFWLIEDEAKYPNEYQLELHQGDCNLLDKFKTGDLVECQVDVRGKKFSKGGRDFIFNSLKVWKISKTGYGQTATPGYAEPVASEPTATYAALKESYRNPPDDLPF